MIDLEKMREGHGGSVEFPDNCFKCRMQKLPCDVIQLADELEEMRHERTLAEGDRTMER